MSAVRIKNDAKIENVSTRVSHLKVVKGKNKPTDHRTIRVDQFWVFCNAALWSNQIFTDAEINEYKKLISEHFIKSRNIDKTFHQLLERVCLAKRYVNRKKGRYISKPIDWLNINYKKGLAGTASWYKVVEKQRKSVPHYNEGIALFSEAVLSYCILPSLYDIRNNHKALIELKQHDLANQFRNTIMFMQYIY